MANKFTELKKVLKAAAEHDRDVKHRLIGHSDIRDDSIANAVGELFEFNPKHTSQKAHKIAEISSYVKDFFETGQLEGVTKEEVSKALEQLNDEKEAKITLASKLEERFSKEDIEKMINADKNGQFSSITTHEFKGVDSRLAQNDFEALSPEIAKFYKDPPDKNPDSEDKITVAGKLANEGFLAQATAKIMEIRNDIKSSKNNEELASQMDTFLDHMVQRSANVEVKRNNKNYLFKEHKYKLVEEVKEETPAEKAEKAQAFNKLAAAIEGGALKQEFEKALHGLAPAEQAENLIKVVQKIRGNKDLLKNISDDELAKALDYVYQSIEEKMKALAKSEKNLKSQDIEKFIHNSIREDVKANGLAPGKEVFINKAKNTFLGAGKAAGDDFSNLNTKIENFYDKYDKDNFLAEGQKSKLREATKFSNDGFQAQATLAILEIRRDVQNDMKRPQNNENELLKAFAAEMDGFVDHMVERTAEVVEAREKHKPQPQPIPPQKPKLVGSIFEVKSMVYNDAIETGQLRPFETPKGKLALPINKVILG